MIKQLKIGWRQYEITEGEHRGSEKGGQLIGEIVYEDNKIYIYNKLNLDNKKVTLLHELLHGIGYLLGNKKFRENEELINALVENLYQVFKDNPELLKYIGSDNNDSG